MPDYNQLRKLCLKNSQVSGDVIDDFILYYAAKQDKLDKEFETRISRFRHVQKDIPSGLIRMFKSQYIVHRIFKQGGLITKYLNHSVIKDLVEEERNFLTHAVANPWRFSFSEIRSNPAQDFYEMQDVFSGDTFLLYSPSVSKSLSEHPILIWFNLIAFNGDCWQTFGPVSGYKCFVMDDIFFFATELNDSIDWEADLLIDVENNPIPYLMLMTGSNYPLVRHGEFEVVQVIGESHAVISDMQALKNEFKLEYAHGVFKLSHAVWSGPPHFAEAFYDEEQEITFLSALTDLGYQEMSELLNASDFNLPVDPEIRLHLPMVMVIKQLLKKEVELNPYSKLFEITSSPESNAQMAKLNKLLSLAMPFINDGKEPDIETMAREIGMDPEIARELIEQTVEKFKKLQR